ncbi:unnamed protein product [Prorocentrum cordatum]|uniref:DUF3987 domain-containing protein n=1 Tax=Prorocentrum cordatum TaxID=2364126 RepID=A0ABN9SI43_9DINO|nr:unnamed protein product [Polarella glacialis]
MSGTTAVSTKAALPYVVVAREKAWYAVDLQLLQFITDDLQRSGGTFTSAIHVWAKQHPGREQQNLILGDFMTQTDNTRVRLEDAWYMHNAIRLAGANAESIEWSFTESGIERALTNIAACVRRAHLARIAEHVRTCPKCVDKLGLELELYTGCQRNAPTKQFFCKFCRPSKIEQAHLIPQKEILGVAPPGPAADGDSALRYVVSCYDPDLPERPFEVHLPRAEVEKDLLAKFEKSLLRSRGDHGNKKSRPAWIKGSRQFARWLRKQAPACEPASSVAASNGGWLALDSKQEEAIQACGVDKLHGSNKVRRCTGGIVTAVTSCGMLVDWMELFRGESIELLYAFALRLHKDGRELGFVIAALGYDNACKLLSLARAKETQFLPWTKSFVEEVRMVLDRFHRDNHTWCLNNMPEVDPLRPDNAKLLDKKNTEACEQLNSWISGRTRSGLEMTRGHFQMHWWILFDAHNQWLEREAACERRRCEAGPMQRRESRRPGRGADASQQLPAMTKGEIRTLYRILENQNPFPEEAARRATPLMWKVASALGKATSLHASCVYVHLMILVATTLGAVQLRYGGILSRHCNLLMLQHGEPGDGKSVALWLDVQVLGFYDMIRERRSKKKYEDAAQKHKDDPDNNPEPAKEHAKDTIFNKGTFIGLGNFMQAQGETAFLALHEGKTWLPQTFDNGPGGGIDDLNQIHDHDLYKNHPGNTQNRFLVRNPHLCGAVMMHIEEVYEQAQKPDTTAGMMRFLIGHFTAVVNKILPDAPAPQVARLLEDDPDYFNDLEYDHVVTAIGKVMLTASALYVRGEERPDEKNKKNRYSKVRGTHFLPWAEDVMEHFRKQFNSAADYVREEARASKGADEDSGYATARKDMTRTLQFIPPLDIGEKVIDYLLQKAGKTPDMIREMTGEEIVNCLGEGEVPLDFVDSVDRVAVAPEIQGPAPHFRNPLSSGSQGQPAQVAQNWDMKAFAQNPCTTEVQIHAAHVDLILLSMMGFLAVGPGRATLAAYRRDSESFVKACNRMLDWDPDVSMEELRQIAPEADEDSVAGDHSVADRLCRGVKDLLEGKAVDFASLQSIEAPHADNVPLEPIPASQVVPATPPEATGAAVPGEQAKGVAGLTQAASGVDETEGSGSRPLKKLRMEPPLQAEEFKTDAGLKKRMLLSVLQSSQDPHTLSKNASSFRGNADTVEAALRVVFRFLAAAGLAVWSQGKSNSGVSVRGPPQVHAEAVCNEIAEKLGLQARAKSKLQESLVAKATEGDFNVDEFKRVSALLGDSLKEA